MLQSDKPAVRSLTAAGRCVDPRSRGIAGDTDKTQLYCLEHGIQPDGYLTEERKASDADQGFSTFFSETGRSPRVAARAETDHHLQAMANMYHEPFTAIWSPMSWTRCELARIAACSTQTR